MISNNYAFQDLDSSNSEYKSLTLSEACEIYYKNLHKFETLKIKTLAKFSDDSQIDSSLKEKLLSLKTKEQL